MSTESDGEAICSSRASGSRSDSSVFTAIVVVTAILQASFIIGDLFQGVSSIVQLIKHVVLGMFLGTYAFFRIKKARAFRQPLAFANEEEEARYYEAIRDARRDRSDTVP